jgi:hypothetical protein
MNKKPVYYMQTDGRWSGKRYPCIGGTMSIGGGGCGETSAAMLIATLIGRDVFPTETMEWACANNYVVAEQGTSYQPRDYFVEQFKQYGLKCERLTNEVCMNRNSPVREKVIRKLEEGNYIIALMKPKSVDPFIRGTWTGGGHFIVVWWADNKIRINDPASTSDRRTNGDPDTFFSEAKYFWVIDAKSHNKGDELDMTKKEFLASLTPEEKAEIVNGAQEYFATQDLPKWAEAEMEEAKRLGITDGTRPMQLIPRYQAAIMAKRAMMDGKKLNLG